MKSETKMDDVEDWQSMADGLSNSALKAGPSRIPRVPFPAKVETEKKIQSKKLKLEAIEKQSGVLKKTLICVDVYESNSKVQRIGNIDIPKSVIAHIYGTRKFCKR